MTYIKQYPIRLMSILLLILFTGCEYNNQVKHCNDSIRLDFVKAIQSNENTIVDTVMLQYKIQQSITERDTLNQLVTLSFLSDAYYELSHYEQSLEALQDFYNLTVKVNSRFMTVFSANKLAYAYLSVNLVDEAARYFYQNLIKVAECDSPNIHVLKEKTEALLGVGIIHSLLETNQKALHHLDKAIKLSKQIDDKNLLGRCYLWKGRTMLNLEEYNSARELFNKSLDINITTNKRSDLGETFYNLGSLEMAEGNLTNAKVNLFNAYNTLTNTKDKINLIRTCDKLGDLYVLDKQTEEASAYYHEAVAIAFQHNLKYYLQSIYYKLYELYHNTGNDKLAVHYQTQSYHYANLLNLNKVQTNLMHIQMDYEEQQKQHELEKISDKYTVISRVQSTIIIASVVIIAFLIIVFSFYYHFMAVRRQRSYMMVKSASIKSNFYKQLTNDFRIPLTIISGLAEKMKNSFADGNSTVNITDLEIIEEQSKDLIFLVNELLAVTNLEMGDKVTWVHGNIVQFVQFLYSGFIEAAQAKSIDFVFHSTTNEIMTNFSKETIRLVINTLLGVLIKYCEDEEQIMVMVRNDEVNQKYYVEINERCNSIHHETDGGELKYYTKNEGENNLLVDFSEHVSLAKYMAWNVGGDFSVKKLAPHGNAFILELPMRDSFRENPIQINPPKLTDFKEENLTEQIDQIIKQEKNRPTILLVEDNLYVILSSLFFKEQIQYLKSRGWGESV